jgi:hypothetical protein
MATHIQHRIGHPASLVVPDRRRIIPNRFAGTAVEPQPIPAPPVEAPRDDQPDMGLFEYARMSRELGREMPQALHRQKPSMLNALMNMSTQRFLLLLVGLALLIGGLIALRFPVFLADFDQWGFQIDCGSGFQSALTQASFADSRYADQCHAAIAARRDWTIPVALVGALMIVGLMVRPPRQPVAVQA